MLVCWQVMPPLSWVKKHFNFRHGVLFPMLDGCPDVKKSEKWYPYRDWQMICFSQRLGRELKSAGFSAHTIQYFPQPRKVQAWGALDSAFFWFRRPEISCELVEKLFSGSGVRKIHVHNCPDPGVGPVVAPGADRMSYSFSTWFDQKSELFEKAGESAFYMAPRAKEGIGMSFLEAMAEGRCVVAPDRPTMNEYIVHGETGFLYDLSCAAPLRIEEVRNIQQQAHAFIREGFSRWEEDKEKIFDWMTAPVRFLRLRLILCMLIRFFRNPVKVIRVLKNEYVA